MALGTTEVELINDAEASYSVFSTDEGTGKRSLTKLLGDTFFDEYFYTFNWQSCIKDFLLENHIKDFSKPVFNISIVHTGGYRIYARHSDRGIAIDPEVSQFSHLTTCDFEQVTRTDSCLHGCNISIPVDHLRAWLGDTAAGSLMNALKITSIGSINGFKVPRSISNIFKFCIDHRLSEELRALQLQARLFDYLVALSTYLNSTLISSSYGNKPFTRARAVHDYLLHTSGKAPTLTMLASRFGASPATLNNEFIASYQQSIFTFLMAYRLEQARLALETGSTPIKTIAHLCGYSHVSHFTAAFKRKFGFTPGALRNSHNNKPEPGLVRSSSSVT
jgi:AraC-like DNA-binding protein